jgi:hypothetical protein
MEHRMLAARELLNLVSSMVDKFEQGGRVAVPEAILQSQYIAIVCMLRAVGHVLYKTDCDEPSQRAKLDIEWRNWKREPIFSTFIEPNRNDLLKEYKGKLVFEGDDVSSGFYADPTNTNQYNVTRAVNYNADTIRNSNGITVLPLFREAIEFWNRHLAEVEKMMASDS